MGIPSNLHGQARALNGGEHIMKLRALITLIENDITVISDDKNRDNITTRVETIRNLLPNHLFLSDSKILSELNDNLQLQWEISKKSQSEEAFIDMVQALVEIESLLREYNFEMCPKCGRVIPIENGIYHKFFGKTKIMCPICKKKFTPKER